MLAAEVLETFQLLSELCGNITESADTFYMLILTGVESWTESKPRVCLTRRQRAERVIGLFYTRKCLGFI